MDLPMFIQHQVEPGIRVCNRCTSTCRCTNIDYVIIQCTLVYIYYLLYDLFNMTGSEFRYTKQNTKCHEK